MNKDTNQIMAPIKAYRMDGLGNNFIIIDRRKNILELNKDKIFSVYENNVENDHGVGASWCSHAHWLA